MHPLVIAHRGASVEAPENALAAFRRAAELGVDMMELDVRRTRDDELVVFHDDTLERITGRPGRIEESDMADLQQLDAGAWFGKQFGRERIPRLADVLELGVPLDIELKLAVDTDRQALLSRVEATVRPYLGRVRMFVSSFDEALVTAARASLAPLPACRIYGEDAVVGEDFGPQQPFAILHGRLATPDLIAAIHQAGAKVLLWTLDAVAQWELAQAAGVDGICTNDPAGLLRWLRS